MSSQDDQPPKPSNQLFQNLFVRREEQETIQAISAGLATIVTNAQRLLEDVRLLVESERYSSATFFLTTANEEIAKFYILIDCCRLDFSKYQSVLKRLCQAFYNHIAKHAYMEIVRHPNLRSMDRVKETWEIEVKKWWPASDPESGEPDMPHDTYFNREMPLYVDFIDFDQKWFAPEAATGKYLFEETSRLSESTESLRKLRDTSEVGLYKPECLSEFHDSLKDFYVTENTKTDEIIRLYQNAGKRIEAKVGIPGDMFEQSALCTWPLYPFAPLGSGTRR